MPKRGQPFVSAREDLNCAALMKIVFPISLACLALGTQLLLIPVVAMDSYPFFLGAVAVSSIYGGANAGLLTLLISSLGKFYFFTPSNILAVDSEIVVRALLFLAVAGVICWIGGRFHAAEQGLSTVLTSIADAVIAIDERGRIKFMNPAAEALSGWRQAAAVKRNFSEVIHIRDSASGAAAIASSHDSQPNPLVTIGACSVLDSKAGYAIPITGNVSLLTNAAGARSGAVIVLRERERAEPEYEHPLHDIRSVTNQTKVLSGMLPICAACKKIRGAGGQWCGLETYVETHSEAKFSHGLCPECIPRYYPEFATTSATAQASR